MILAVGKMYQVKGDIQGSGRLSVELAYKLVPDLSDDQRHLWTLDWYERNDRTTCKTARIKKEETPLMYLGMKRIWDSPICPEDLKFVHTFLCGQSVVILSGLFDDMKPEEYLKRIL